MCSSRTRVVRPGWVRSSTGVWHVVVQSASWDISQLVRASECLYRGKHCEYLPACYRSSCVQNFSPTALLATSLSRRNKPTFITVDLPVSCSCFVHDFVFY